MEPPTLRLRLEGATSGVAWPRVPLRERLLVAAVCAVLFHFVYFKDGTLIYLFNPNGSGLWLDEAYRVRAGEVMYRDFFEFVPPGVVYLNAAVMAVFGPRITPFGYLGLALGTLLSVLVHALSARLVGPRWRLLPPALFASLIYASGELGDHKSLAVLWAFASLLALVGRPRTRARLLTAGACLGLGVLFTTDLGLGAALGLTCGLACEPASGRALRTFALGGLFPVLLVASWFSLQAGFGTLFYDTIVFPLTHYRNANPFVAFLGFGELRVAPRTLAHLALGSGCLASALGFIVGSGILAGNAASDSRLAGRQAPLRLVALTGLGLALAYLQRAIYPARLAVASALLLVPLASALEALSQRTGIARYASRAFLACLVFGCLWSSLGLIYRRQWQRAYRPESHRAGTILPLAPMPELSWIERNTRPGEAVFLLPNKGGFYFLSQTRNPTSFSRLELGGLNPPDQLRVLAHEIEVRQPRVGVWQEVAVLPAFLSQSSLDPLYREIRRGYKCEDRTRGGALLLRRRAATDLEGTDPC